MEGKIEGKEELGIYDLARAVRGELKKLIGDPEMHATPLVKLEEINLELNVSITKVVEGGIKFWILSAGGKGEKQVGNVIKLKFKPIADIPGLVVQKITMEKE